MVKLIWDACWAQRWTGLSLLPDISLESEDKRFGGLSGLVVPQWGQLLSVTDKGDWVSIGLDKAEGAAPLNARMADMRGSTGAPLSGKSQADAEGLALANGVALVSFERDHRVAAFDLTTCQSAARAVPVMSLGDAVNTPNVGANGGLEALALSSDGGLVLGLEDLDSDRAALSLAPKHGVADFSLRLPEMDGRSLTGADFLSLGPDNGVLYSVFRSFSPLTGPRIALTRTQAQKDEDTGWQLGITQTLMRLSLPAPVDNFEGVAAFRGSDGITRIYLVSDDNFSPNQRSLLFVFKENAFD